MRRFIIILLLTFAIQTVHAEESFRLRNADFVCDFSVSYVKNKLPTDYTSTAAGLVTSVKNQSRSGPCWAMAMTSVLESSFIKSYSAKINFSAMNMIYCMNRGASLNNPYEFDYDEGGNYKIAAAYYSSGRGPVLEKDDPYIAKYTPRKFELKPLANYVRGMVFIPEPDKTDEVSLKHHRDLIKHYVMQYGSVSTDFHWDNYYFDSSSVNYYCNASFATQNHSAAIIGWDDNYSRKNFKLEPIHDGAFILKNSWGKTAHDNGFFYMSYDDVYAGANCCAIIDIATASPKYQFNNIYQYDYFGITDSTVSSNESVFLCNVFDRRNDGEVLTDVGVYTASNDVSCEVYVTRSNQYELSECLAKTVIKFPGYYVIKLDKRVKLDKTFGIVVKLSGENLKIPIESVDALKIKQHNRSFYMSNDVWIQHYNNLCIKGFTEMSSKFDNVKFQIAKPNENQSAVSTFDNRPSLNVPKPYFSNTRSRNLSVIINFAIAICLLTILVLKRR